MCITLKVSIVIEILDDDLIWNILIQNQNSKMKCMHAVKKLEQRNCIYKIQSLYLFETPKSKELYSEE